MVNLDSIKLLKTDSISENKFCPKAIWYIIKKSNLFYSKITKKVEENSHRKQIYSIVFDSSPNPKRDGANNYASVYNYFFLEKANEKEEVIFQYRFNPAKKEFTLIDMKTGEVFTEDLSKLPDELFQEYENCCQ
jgi:hypothetical protein